MQCAHCPKGELYAVIDHRNHFVYRFQYNNSWYEAYLHIHCVANFYIVGEYRNYEKLLQTAQRISW